MPYCSTEDLKKLADEKAILRLCDDAGTASGLDDEAVASVIAEAIEQVESEIDGYLAGRYKTPLDPAPRMVSGLAARMTMFYLSMRRPGGKDERWEKLHSGAVDILKQIAKGVVRIGAVELEAREVEKESGSLVVSAPEKMFDRDFINRM